MTDGISSYGSQFSLKNQTSSGIRRRVRSGLVVLASLVGASLPIAKAEATSRPPQYVLLAFDGSSSHNMWDQTLNFAKDMDAKGKDVRFTYFVSGVYYVGAKNKRNYIAPKLGAGKSAIGWGADASDLLGRFDRTNRAYREGHEIASHANGHFDGSQWTENEWDSEFRQFNDLIFDFSRINLLSPTPLFPTGWLFGQNDVVGFRAPLLGVSPGLWPTLAKYNFRYDTSKVANANYWPGRNLYGTWNFPLASLVIAGTAKKTLSMDYNFYVAQSKGQADPVNGTLYEEQMYQTYLRYFEGNYNSNRAPLHIGHHFSLWNGGAYWRAMKRFAEKVCGMPEVRCSTYKELADFMDSRKAKHLMAYQSQHFSSAKTVQFADTRMRPFDVNLEVTLQANGELSIATTGRDAQVMAAGALVKKYFLNDKEVPLTSFTLEEVRKRTEKGRDAWMAIKVYRGGSEILTRTHQVRNVGEIAEEFVLQAEEDKALIGDPSEAHF